MKKRVFFYFKSENSYKEAIDYMLAANLPFTCFLKDNRFLTVSQTLFKKNPHLDLYLGADRVFSRIN